MAQPTLTIITVAPNQAGWDTTVNTNFDTLRAAFEDNPLIVHVVASKASLPAASSNESTLALVEGDANAYNDGLYHSDGTSWRLVLQLDAEQDGQLLLTHDGEVCAKLKRRSNAGASQALAEFALLDSGSSEQVYARHGAEVRTNTAGSEDGDWILEVVRSGALTELLRAHGDASQAVRAVAGPIGMPSFTLAGAPATALQDGDLIWISDGRKTGEGVGSGTGVVAYWDSTSAAWLRLSDDTAVAT